MAYSLADAYDRAVRVPVDQFNVLKHYHFGNREIVTGDGWRFLVFVDAGELDYFDTITAPDGTSWDFTAIHGAVDQRLALFFEVR